MGREFHVSKSGNDKNPGSKEKPFLTIQRAADLAMPGDTVIVHKGEYREWVDPKMGGISDLERIVYRAAPCEKVVIKGSERVTGWKNLGGSVWEAVIPNTLFGDFNPFDTYLYGDWMIDPPLPFLHLGEVFLNGKAFYEAYAKEDVWEPQKRTFGCSISWKSYKEPILDPEGTLYQWHAVVDEENTIITANFQGQDPNKELTEISVRECVFYPKSAGRNYITVSGFELCQAACRFAPPTGNQPGLIGPHMSKGWIIEDNDIHDAKCAGVSLGKDEETGDNLFTRTRRKPGYTYQFESVCKALSAGWSRDTIGSHIIRGNVIHDCGQNGIVGHLGCIFSRIEKNEIYNIAVKHEFFGYEIAGIKLHAAIDAQIVGNYVHDCTLGAWFDWETQGTRISKNIFAGNIRDLMVEVSHGPYLVDNNIFASPYSLENASQGGAYVHNLFLGNIRHWNELRRSTPYHVPHSTSLMGTSFIYGGDDRFFQNIFCGGANDLGEGIAFPCGTKVYDGHPAGYEEYISLLKNELPADIDNLLYEMVKQPVYIDRNVYLGGALWYEREEHFVSDDAPFLATFHEEVSEDGKRVYAKLDVPNAVFGLHLSVLDTKDLGITRAAEEGFEDPDGRPIVLDEDICGNKRTEESSLPGPFAGLTKGSCRILVWESR